MEITTYRKATIDDCGLIVWFGDLCHDCHAPICFEGDTFIGGGYTWVKRSHSCSEVLRKRIEALENRIAGLESRERSNKPAVNGPIKKTEKFWTRKENPFLENQ